MKSAQTFLAIFIAIISFVRCGNGPVVNTVTVTYQESDSRIRTDIQNTITTYRIAYNLVDRQRKMKPVENPVRNDLFSYFKDFQDEPVVYLAVDLGYDDMVVKYLLHKKEFPEQGVEYNHNYLRTSHEFYQSNWDRLDSLYQQLSEFYQKANVNAFILKHQVYYEGAVSEIERIVDSLDVIEWMEEYTNQFNVDYVIVPEPLFLTPRTRGIGPRILSSDGLVCYQFISPVYTINTVDAQGDPTDQFGYDDEEYIRRMSVHEFGHSFVNPVFESPELSEIISKKDTLFTQKIQRSLRNRGVGNMRNYIIENIVRTLEIRIADLYVSKSVADELRKKHKEFIYIDRMEKELIDNYEVLPMKERKFSEAIPRLVALIN